VNSRIEHADAMDWLSRQAPGSARVVVFDPPYSRSTPMRGREDGMAGSVYEPFGFLHQALELSAKALLAPPSPKNKTEFGQQGPHGIIMCFGDWELLPTLGYLSSISGLRWRTHLVWIQDHVGGGRLFRGDADPVLIVAKHSPGIVGGEHAPAAKNWIVAKVPPQGRERVHPYQKPPEVYEYVFRRVCRRGDTILDPFAGSGASRTAAENLKLDLRWSGCDIDKNYAEEN
jgi:hypothetical protein